MMTPKNFVEELDKHIIGQENAKKTLAIAMRNRWRRMQLKKDIRDEITPKNILMMGPTGVGKTAIVKALADITDAPFVKVEATKYTQVGYVGATVKEMVDELAHEAARKLGKEKKDNGIFLNNDLDSIFSDFMNKSKHSFTLNRPEKFYRTNLVTKGRNKVKKALAKELFVLAKKYGYNGSQSDLFMRNNILFSKEQVKEIREKRSKAIKEREVVSKHLFFHFLKSDDIIFFTMGYKPHTVKLDEKLKWDLEDLKDKPLLKAFLDFAYTLDDEYITEMIDVYLENYSEDKEKDTELCEHLHNYIINDIYGYDITLVNSVRINRVNKLLKVLTKKLFDNVFIVAKKLGYIGTKSSVEDNDIGFYTYSDLLDFKEKFDKKLDNKKMFCYTYDPLFLINGYVPKCLLEKITDEENEKEERRLKEKIIELTSKQEYLKVSGEYIKSGDYRPFFKYLDKMADLLPTSVVSKGEIPDLKRMIVLGILPDFKTSVNSPKLEKSKNESVNNINGSKQSSVADYVHEKGIIFIDEIDKLASGKNDISKDNVGKIGVQRDLLALLDGTVVSTGYGDIKTENIMFITAGAFHLNSVSDLMPELLGRLPVQVKLEPMNEEMLLKILKNEKGSPIRHHVLLLTAEGVNIDITDDAIEAIAKLASIINKRHRNMGARTLQGVIDRIFTEISFDCDGEKKEYIIDEAYINGIKKKILGEYNNELFKKYLKDNIGMIS